MVTYNFYMSQINNLNDIDEQSDSDSPQLPTSNVLNFENNDDISEEYMKLI